MNISVRRLNRLVQKLAMDEYRKVYIRRVVLQDGIEALPCIPETPGGPTELHTGDMVVVLDSTELFNGMSMTKLEVGKDVVMVGTAILESATQTIHQRKRHR